MDTWHRWYPYALLAAVALVGTTALLRLVQVWRHEPGEAARPRAATQAPPPVLFDPRPVAARAGQGKAGPPASARVCSVGKEWLGRQIEPHEADVVSCLPQDVGSVTVHFVIGHDGTVGRAEIRKTDAGDEAKTCVLEKVRAMTFVMGSDDPCKSGPVPVVYPFGRDD